METIESQINMSYDILTNLKINFVIQDTHVFYDEPAFPFYSAYIDKIGDHLDNYILPKERIVAGALSSQSRKLALLKTLNELLERFSLSCVIPEKIIYKNYQEVRNFSIYPFIYSKPSQKKIGWIWGNCLLSKKKVLIPAQKIFLNYYQDIALKKNIDEPVLNQFISTGAAAGYDKEETIVRGLLEIIERDAMMTNYLNKIPSKEISLSKINDPILNKLINIIKKYQLSLFVFNITNDIPIPTHLSIIIDESGVGPVLTVGTKCEFDPLASIIGSIEEALMARTWLRYEIFKSGNKKLKKNGLITTRLERAIYWNNKNWKKRLAYLYKRISTDKIKQKYLLNKKQFVPQKKLNFLISLLHSLGYKAYSYNIKPTFIKNKKIFIYKMLIPKLQLLYLNEKNKNLNFKRLKLISHFFSKKKCNINKIPHPFL